LNHTAASLDETLVIYYAAPDRYGIRAADGLRARGSHPWPHSHERLQLSVEPAVALPGLTPVFAPITDEEFEELSSLRKARAWGTPLFQPNHPRYGQALARLQELEAKEQAAAVPVPTIKEAASSHTMDLVTRMLALNEMG
jgi:hypothetical protein